MKELLQARVLPLNPKHNTEKTNKSIGSKKQSKKDSDKAIQTFFRTNLKNSYTMLEAVDRKANIIISINAIVLSILLSTAYSSGLIIGLESKHLIALVLFSVVSIFFALKAVKPFVLQPQQIGLKDNNMLNLVAIKNVDVQTYKSRLKTVIKKEKLIYNSLAEDLYFVGQNVNAKHKYLQFSSYAFVGGIVLSLILLVV